MFDVTQQESPQILSTIQLSGGIDTLALAGKRIIAGGRDRLYVLRIVAPNTMMIENVIELQGEVCSVVAAGDYGYAAVGSSVVLFDIPTATILDQRSYPNQTIQDLALAGDNIFVLSIATKSNDTGLLQKIPVEDYLADASTALELSLSPGQGGDPQLFLFADGQFVYVSARGSDLGSVAPMQVIEDDGVNLRLVTRGPHIEGQIRPTSTGELVFTDLSRGNASAEGLGVMERSAPGDLLQTLKKTQQPLAAMTLYFGRAFTVASHQQIEVNDLLVPSRNAPSPSVRLDVNSRNGFLTENSLVRVTAIFTGVSAIRSVEFYVDDRKVATDGDFPFEYRFVAPDSATQPTLELSACAVDLNNKRSCSTRQTLSVTKDKQPLRVLSVSPYNGSHAASHSISRIEARFSHPLDLATLSSVNARLQRLDSQSGSAMERIRVSGLTFQPITNKVLLTPEKQLASGTYQVTLSSSIMNTSGTRLAKDYVWTFTTGNDDVWINPGSGNWNVASSWSGGIVPQPGDSVTIATPGVTVTYNQGSLDISNLTVGAGSTLSVAGGTLAIDGAGSVAGTLSLAGGTVQGSGTTTVNGEWNWTGGNLGTTLNLGSGSAALVSPSNYNAASLLTSGTINNQGTVEMMTGLTVAGQINNLNGSTWNLGSDATVFGQTGGVFKNSGSLTKTGGTSNTNWGVPVTGSGSISITSGTLNLTGTTSGTISGTINLGSGAVINYAQNDSTLSSGGVTGSGTFNFYESAGSNFSVTVAGTYSFSGSTQILINVGYLTAPTVTFTGHTTMANLNFRGGTITGAGSVTIPGQYNWTGGTISTVMVLGSTSVTTITGNSLVLSGGTIDNQGMVALTTGYNLSVSGTMNNLKGATWSIQADGTLTGQTGSLFNNSGHLTKTGGTSTTNWGVPVTGSGTMSVTSGTLNLTGTTTGTVSGTINVGSGAVVNYAQNGSTLSTGGVIGTGTFNFFNGNPSNFSVTVAGTYSFSGTTQILINLGYLTAPTVTFTGRTTMANLNFSGGTMTGAGSVTIPGQYNWTGGTVSTVMVLGSTSVTTISTTNPNSMATLIEGTINNQGNVAMVFVSGYGITVGGTINNLKGASWNIQADGTVTLITGGVFNNSGHLTKTGGTSTTNWGVPVTGSGTMSVTSGTLNLTGTTTGTVSGTINVGSGAVVNYAQNGSTLSTGGVIGTGTFNFFNGNPSNFSVTVAGTYSFSGTTQILINLGYLTAPTVTFTGRTTMANLNFSGGTMTGAGSVTILGVFNWTGGTVNVKIILDPSSVTTISTTNPNSIATLSEGTINNQGKVAMVFVSGYGVRVGGTINNLKGAIWNIQADGTVTLLTGGVFNNSGSLTKTGGTSTTNWEPPVTGTGSITVTSGTLSFTGSTTGTISGPINVGSGAVVNYAQDGSTLSKGGVTGTGTFSFFNASPSSFSVIVAGTYSFSGTTQILINVGYLTAPTVTFTGHTTVADLSFSGGTMMGTGSITVNGSMNWTGGAVQTTGTFVASSLTLATGGSISIALGSSAITVTDNITLAGTLSLSFTGSYSPNVGTQISIFTFSSGFTGDFGAIENLVLGDGDPLAVNLTADGLSVTVEPKPDLDKAKVSVFK